jgi:hypothetical protein
MLCEVGAIVRELHERADLDRLSKPPADRLP